MSKFCSNCGKEINENADVCLGCGIEIKKDIDTSKNNTNNKLKCPKCQSDNISIQITTKSKLVTKHHGILWWLFVSWWWLPIKWLIFTVPALIFKIFGIGKKHKIKNTEQKLAVCQSCGNSWKLK